MQFFRYFVNILQRTKHWKPQNCNTSKTDECKPFALNLTNCIVLSRKKILGMVDDFERSEYHEIINTTISEAVKDTEKAKRFRV